MNAYDLHNMLSTSENNEDFEKQYEFQQALKKYVEEFECNAECSEIIRKNIKNTIHSELIVYRGHGKSDQIRSNVGWFSTSKSKKVAKEEFSGKECCVFTIHVLENVPILDVYNHIPKGRVGHEDEILVLGGGTFYTSRDLDTVGFTALGNGEFETWYNLEQSNSFAPPLVKPDVLTVSRVLEIIPKDEYDFIDSPDDITMDIPDSLKQQVFERINVAKDQAKSL